MTLNHPEFVKSTGYFEAGISPDGAAVVPDAKPGQQATLWLAFKWEGMQPLALYPTTPQQAAAFFWMQRGGVPNRLKMLRCNQSAACWHVILQGTHAERDGASAVSCTRVAGGILLDAARRRAVLAPRR